MVGEAGVVGEVVEELEDLLAGAGDVGGDVTGSSAAILWRGAGRAQPPRIALPTIFFIRLAVALGEVAGFAARLLGQRPELALLGRGQVLLHPLAALLVASQREIVQTVFQGTRRQIAGRALAAIQVGMTS